MAIYMKFADFKGRVQTDGFKDWIELTSFQLGVARAVTSGSGGKQREGSVPAHSDLTVTKVFDEASADLYSNSLAGAFDSKVEVKFTATTKSKTDTFLAYELTACGVSSYTVSSHGDNPIESITMSFTKVLLSPSPLDDKGSPKAGKKVTWDALKLAIS